MASFPIPELGSQPRTTASNVGSGSGQDHNVDAVSSHESKSNEGGMKKLIFMIVAGVGAVAVIISLGVFMFGFGTLGGRVSAPLLLVAGLAGSAVGAYGLMSGRGQQGKVERPKTL